MEIDPKAQVAGRRLVGQGHADQRYGWIRPGGTAGRARRGAGRLGLARRRRVALDRRLASNPPEFVVWGESALDPGAHAPATWADVDDLIRDFGYRPDTPIEAGIARFVAWYRQFYNR